LTAASMLPASGHQVEEVSSPITPAGELLRLHGGSLSLPPSNGPGMTPNGSVTAKLSFSPPPGRPSFAHALAYFAISSDAAIDITGSFILSLKSPNGSPCNRLQTDVAFLGASGWDRWERHFSNAELGCDAAGDYVATLTPLGGLRFAPGSPIVVAVFSRPATKEK
jgi:hypothetical protein